ncbi:hypothetical protein PtA15_8A400 [Puccinia triticina]|uniref:F-box domain-containing protein n=1 Tax=Puccinia triticina TaxID=208348 RepID=A0ABY7CQF6_9BASI|nr:uncharacterized protein PtA15_8A400 [Puccinia triticina]WAQ87496.1 hypothetical protein PtA15_8A400 [Puccinia triticina]
MLGMCMRSYDLDGAQWPGTTRMANSLRRVARVYELRKTTTATTRRTQTQEKEKEKERKAKAKAKAKARDEQRTAATAKRHRRALSADTHPSSDSSASASSPHFIHHHLPTHTERRRSTISQRTSLLHLPAELIFQIAQLLLAPTLTIEQWDQPADDLLNFSATCRTIRQLSFKLTSHQLTLTIDRSAQHSLSKATQRIKQLVDHSPNRTQWVRKLLIKDHADDLRNSSRARRNWYASLADLLQHHLPSIEFLCYARNLELVTERSPYELLSIDQTLLQSIAKLARLKTLYLSGLELQPPPPPPRRSPAHQTPSMTRNELPASLENLHLIAVHDSVLCLIKRCPALKELRIWRDFLVSYPSIDHWLSNQQWATLESLRLKGLYGNSVVGLQSSLRESRQMISNTGIKINLHTLDLDEPYSTNDLLRLLEAFKSPVLRTLRLTLWRDHDFNPSLLEKLAERFPNLEDLQVILETPLRRWWPHKLNAWAESLSKFEKLRRLTWNCSPFTCHDFMQVQAGMKAQVMVLGSCVPTLERVSYVDISGWLEIERRSGAAASGKKKKNDLRSSGQKPGCSAAAPIKSIKWAGVQFRYPFLGCNKFWDADEDEEEDADDWYSDEEGEEAEDQAPVASAGQAGDAGETEASGAGVPERPGTVGGGGAENVLVREAARKITVYDPFSAGPSDLAGTNSSLTSTLSLLSSCSPPAAPGLSSTSTSSTLARPASAIKNPAPPPPPTACNHHRLRNSHSYSRLLLGQIIAMAGSSSSSSHPAASAPSDSNTPALQSASAASSSSDSRTHTGAQPPSLIPGPDPSGLAVHHPK